MVVRSTSQTSRRARLSSEADDSKAQPNGRRVLADTLIVLGMAAGIVLLHFWVAGPVPSGGDGGNWLALAHQHLGVDVLTPGVTYPPVFTSLLASLLLVRDPVPAVVVASLIARIIATAAVYLVMRDAGRIVALVSASVTAVMAFQLEAYAWGAYPQILGLAFGLLATRFAVRYAEHLNRSDALVAMAAGVATALTHTLVAALLIVVLPIAGVHAGWVSTRVRENWLRGLGLIVAIATLVGLYLAFGVLGSEGRAVMNPSELDLLEGLNLAFGESSIPWLVTAAIGIGSLFHRRWQADQSIPVSVGAGWFLAGTALFVATGERRSLLVAQVGIMLLAASELSRWWRSTDGRPRARTALLMLSAAMVGSIAIPGVSKYRQSTDFYRIVDSSEVEALQFLEGSAQMGDTVLASRGRNTIPIGWWVEGIAKLPTISGHDPRFLTFPSEIAEAEQANSFFEGEMGPQGSIEFLEEAGVRFVIVDKRGPDAGWMFRADRPTYPVIYDSPTLAIFKVRSQPQA